MDANAIIECLATADVLPREARRAAKADRVALAPLFVREVGRHLDREPADRTHARQLFFIFHLLGDWCETSAYRTLARLLQLTAEEVETIRQRRHDHYGASRQDGGVRRRPAADLRHHSRYQSRRV